MHQPLRRMASAPRLTDPRSPHSSRLLRRRTCGCHGADAILSCGRPSFQNRRLVSLVELGVVANGEVVVVAATGTGAHGPLPAKPPPEATPLHHTTPIHSRWSSCRDEDIYSNDLYSFQSFSMINFRPRLHTTPSGRNLAAVSWGWKLCLGAEHCYTLL